MRRALGLFTIALLVPALLLMTGCADMFDWDEENAVALPVRYVIAPQAPPAPIAEYAPWPSRTPEQIWRPGYWIYNGASFEWIPGAVVARPSPTAVWAPDHWAKHEYGWAFISGHWQ